MTHRKSLSVSIPSFKLDSPPLTPPQSTFSTPYLHSVPTLPDSTSNSRSASSTSLAQFSPKTKRSGHQYPGTPEVTSTCNVFESAERGFDAKTNVRYHSREGSEDSMMETGLGLGNLKGFIARKVTDSSIVRRPFPLSCSFLLLTPYR
jgi:hypothetical protein